MRVDRDALGLSPGAPPAESGAPTGGRRASVRAAIGRRLTAEHLVVLLLGLLVLVVHDVGYMLSQSFWTDESWVAITTRFPLSQLPAITSSTPIGWSALVRVVTVGGSQVSRLLPLAFAGAAVVVAYWFARRLGWRLREVSVAAGLLAGLGVLLVPAMLVRDDLKQYTADACIALLMLAATSRLEREWSRRGLAGLSVAVWGGMLFSHTVAFAGIAAFGSLCAVQLVQRAWRRLAEAVVAGACTAVLMLGVYEAFDAHAVLPRLTGSHQFVPDYLPITKGLHAGITFVTSHFDAVHAYFGLGPAWLAVPLFAAGLITILRLGRPVTALTVAVLWPEMLAVSALKKYPFLNLRTSTFLFAITVVVAAIGLIGACSLLRPWLKAGAAAGRTAVAVVALAAAALAVAVFAGGAQPYARSHLIPNEDVRGQALYVAHHAARRDVVVVNLSSNWGFGYYWPVGQPSRRANAVVLQGYETYFPGQPRIIVASSRDPAGVGAALSRALALARQQACVRIWLVRTHMVASERAAWAAALGRQGLSATPVGDSGLRVMQVGRSCR
jgi:hypothetical protein